jgi:hypothetical protein
MSISSDDFLPSPHWHESILEQREKSIATGEARFIDWELAKIEIRKKVSRLPRQAKIRRLQRP